MTQEELIKKMDDDELRRQLIYSQLLFLCIGIFLSFIFFDSIFDWLTYLYVDYDVIFYYGLLPGLIIVIINLFLYKILPRRLLDDGGINEKIFKNQSALSIVLIAFVVAVSEEFLFRGFMQTTFGYLAASSIFVLIHFRYLKRPVLLIMIIFTSFYIGYLFLVTGSLLATITAHFIVDLLLGLVIKYRR